MLVLTRTVGQSVTINDNIEVTVVSLSDGKIRLGITAPKSIPIHRSEIHARIVAQKAETEARAKAADSDQNLTCSS